MILRLEGISVLGYEEALNLQMSLRTFSNFCSIFVFLPEHMLWYLAHGCIYRYIMNLMLASGSLKRLNCMALCLTLTLLHKLAFKDNSLTLNYRILLIDLYIDWIDKFDKIRKIKVDKTEIKNESL